MLKNLTPHPLDIYPIGLNGPPSIYQPHACLWPEKDMQPIRLPETSIPYSMEHLHSINHNLEVNVPIHTVTYKPVQLPPYQKGAYYIVPRLVADMLRARGDLVFPYKLLREPRTNKVIGATVLGRFHTQTCACGGTMVPVQDKEKETDIYTCQECKRKMIL